MLLKKYIFGILMIVCSIHSIAQTTTQTTNTAKPKKHRFAVYGGFGPNYYFNNLQIGKNYVNEFNYSFVGRFMWEPEHLLSLGVESGYYRLYTFNSPAPNQAHISNTAIPLQVVVSMKFLTTFYVNFSMGQSILLNKANSPNYGDFSAHAVSVADFTGTVGYRYRLPGRFSIGGEAKYFYSSSFVDRSFALVFVGGFSF
jgi:hypothetical protein